MNNLLKESVLSSTGNSGACIRSHMNEVLKSRYFCFQKHIFWSAAINM